MTRALRTLLASTLLAACVDTGPARIDAPADSAAGEVAFELAGPGGAVLVVPVSINGGAPLQFVLDTGATITYIDKDVALRSDLPKVRGVIGTGAGVGGQGQLELVQVDSLQVGAVVAHDLQACVVDLQHLEGMGIELDGLLGLNVLQEFRVTLDFQRGIVRFESHDSAAPR